MSIREVINGVIYRAQKTFKGNDAGNAPVLLMLGDFKFSLNTAVFQEQLRSTSYRWAGQERVGQLDALQFTGPGEDNITLPGVVYPDFRGGPYQVDDLRTIASQGKPLRLVFADGTIGGDWVITNIEDTKSIFKIDGGARKQEFSLSIRRFA